MAAFPAEGRGQFNLFRSVDAGKTATRLGPGYPLRFFSSWLESLSRDGGLTNPDRDRSVSKANADLLFNLIFAR